MSQYTAPVIGLVIFLLGIAGIYNTRALTLMRERIERLEEALRELNPGLDI